MFVRAAITRFGPDIVYHLAAVHYIPECEDRPTEALAINTIGTQVLLNHLGEAKKLVFASTSSVYKYEGNPYKETDPYGPSDVYGITKVAAEQLVMHHSKITDRPCVISRFYNVYGEEETNPHVIPVIIQQLKSGARKIKLGNLVSKRDFIFIDDLIEALVILGKIPTDGFDVFNIGSSEFVSVRELVKIMSDIIGAQVEVEIDPARIRKNDPPLLAADNTKLKETTGWMPKFDIKSGLTRILMIDGLIQKRPA
jgi:UDP-glucose 4-epimerase